MMSSEERLKAIKNVITRIDNLHPAFDNQRESELEDLFVNGNFHFLIEQAELFQNLAGHHNAALAENKRLSEALKFYADKVSYEMNVTDEWEPVIPVNKDLGEIARKALEASPRSSF